MLGVTSASGTAARLTRSTRPATLAPTVRRRATNVRCSTAKPGDKVLVAGSTGGVGQLVVAKLLERGYKVRALTRNVDKAKQLFNSDSADLEIVAADARDASTLAPVMAGVDAICCATGTTAFPSSRWEGGNGPKPTDLVGTTNLIKAAPAGIKRFVLVTSAGVERPKQFPWAILNTFGVLTFKRQAEETLEASGLPYTLLRPSRLTDGPYTSFDLNTLLKATSGSRQDITLSPRDDLTGEASRIAVAEAVVQSLALEATANQAYAIASVPGDGPGTDAAAWEQLFVATTEAKQSVTP